MMQEKYRIVSNSDSAITVLFDSPRSEELSTRILQYTKSLRKKWDNVVFDFIPGYQSLTLVYAIQKINPQEIESSIHRLLSTKLESNQSLGKIIDIPVCYDPEFGPDLAYVANYCSISVEELVHLHSTPEYLVHMLGFLPGFLYLGGLTAKLKCPRKNQPRLRVEAGSVGIGGDQTGVYPVPSPGGWQIIGRTPLRIFDPQSEQPFAAEPLDKIKFIPISAEEYKHLSGGL